MTQGYTQDLIWPLVIEVLVDSRADLQEKEEEEILLYLLLK